MLLRDDQQFHVHLGDSIKHMSAMPEACVDLSIYSPPFSSVYAYTNEAGDLGNSENFKAEIPLHFSFFFRQIRRVIKPGRVMMVHCQQVVRMKRSGEVGMYDFRGLLIRLAVRAGFIYEYDWLIGKNPQAQAILTKSRQLQFAGLETDRAASRGAMGDYLIKFRVPGENAVPIADRLEPTVDPNNWLGEPRQPQVSRNDWINWAEAYWPWNGDNGIRQSKTLNVAAGRAQSDTKHICPLQLDVINRAVRLYSNPGEIVFSPFAGIGSEGYESLKLGRRFYGVELKAEYHAAALANLAAACKVESEQPSLFSAAA